MPEITVISEIKPKILPSLAGIRNFDAIAVGGGLGMGDIGRKGLIQRSTLSTSTVSGLANGSQIINEVRLRRKVGSSSINVADATSATSPDSGHVIAIVERAVYVDSKTNANLLPGGSSIDESQWQVIGDGMKIIKLDGTEVSSGNFASFSFDRGEKSVSRDWKS